MYIDIPFLLTQVVVLVLLLFISLEEYFVFQLRAVVVDTFLKVAFPILGGLFHVSIQVRSNAKVSLRNVCSKADLSSPIYLDLIK